MYWRRSGYKAKVYPSCAPIDLPQGLLISHDYQKSVEYIREGTYQQMCYEGTMPMLNTNVGLILQKFTAPLPIVAESWIEFTQHSLRGSFSYSVVAIVYSISVLAVIIIFLTIFVLTNYTIKPSALLKLSTCLSSIYILVVVIKSILILHGQQIHGYLSGTDLLYMLNTNLAINSLDLILVFLLQINQVQVIMRIFLRQKDKRLTFFVGIIASFTSQAIWGVSQFHTFSEDNEAGDILPAFIYLVRIAMGLCYAAILTVYFLSKIQYILANRQIWLLSLLTVILIYSPVAFFVADVANAFIFELSDVFSVVTYVICVVIPWEWCNKFNIIMKTREKEGVLGRRFYEDEIYELDRFELFVEELVPDEKNDNHPSNEGDQNNLNTINNGGNAGGGKDVTTNIVKNLPANENDLDRIETNKAAIILQALQRSKAAFLNLTDNIIAAGFAIPRSVSASTQSIAARIRESQMTEIMPHISNARFERLQSNVCDSRNTNVETSTAGGSSSDGAVTLLNNGRSRRNVYVYSRKEVVIDVPDE